MGGDGGVVTIIAAAFPHFGLMPSGLANMAGHLFFSVSEASVHAKNTLVNLIVEPHSNVTGTDSKPFVVRPGKPLSLHPNIVSVVTIPAGSVFSKVAQNAKAVL